MKTIIKLIFITLFIFTKSKAQIKLDSAFIYNYGADEGRLGWMTKSLFHIFDSIHLGKFRLNEEKVKNIELILNKSRKRCIRFDKTGGPDYFIIAYYLNERHLFFLTNWKLLDITKEKRYKMKKKYFYIFDNFNMGLPVLNKTEYIDRYIDNIKKSRLRP